MKSKFNKSLSLMLPVSSVKEEAWCASSEFPGLFLPILWSIQTENFSNGRPRVSCLSAYCGPHWRPPLNLSVPYFSVKYKGSGGVLNGSPMMPRGASLSGWWLGTFQMVERRPSGWHFNQETQKWRIIRYIRSALNLAEATRQVQTVYRDLRKLMPSFY